MKNFDELTEQEILALAISLEEDDERTYNDFVHSLKDTYPATADLYRKVAAEENRHRHMLVELYREKFGEHIPLIRREAVSGFVKRSPVWVNRPLGIEKIRDYAELMEMETARFYSRAARRSEDASIRQLLGDLAAAEREHTDLADRLESETVPLAARHAESEASRRLFLLQVVQPGLAGLMDGSVSTLAPLFAAAFATHSSWSTFLVGLAASVGAGISMGFAEALSDNGSLTGRGEPWLRGLICGLMTSLGGLGHTLPFLIPDFYTAIGVAVGVVLVELAAISWVRHRYMETPLVSAAIQVGFGGALVFLAGVVIGSG
ncbi:MAG TPA: ferritin family protein [Stellaceae bacterium]|nr:ferritin family protein [Stellaceae bacterium]